MLINLQVRKLTHLFGLMDADASGTLGRADYVLLADRAADVHGWASDSPERAEVRSQFVAQWTGLQVSADCDANGGVTLDEWLQYQDYLISNPEYFESLVGGTVDFFFDLMDDDRDGQISRDELERSFVVFGVDVGLVDDAMPYLDTDGDGVISKTEYHQIVMDFFGSDDPNAAGNWMLGPL